MNIPTRLRTRLVDGALVVIVLLVVVLFTLYNQKEPVGYFPDDAAMADDGPLYAIEGSLDAGETCRWFSRDAGCELDSARRPHVSTRTALERRLNGGPIILQPFESMYLNHDGDEGSSTMTYTRWGSYEPDASPAERTDQRCLKQGDAGWKEYVCAWLLPQDAGSFGRGGDVILSTCTDGGVYVRGEYFDGGGVAVPDRMPAPRNAGVVWGDSSVIFFYDAGPSWQLLPGAIDDVDDGYVWPPDADMCHTRGVLCVDSASKK